MTKSKKSSVFDHSKLELAQFRLRNIAAVLASGEEISATDKAFIIDAFKKIGRGEDANKELGVKAGRGESKSYGSQILRERKIFACAWVASAMRPPPDGLGLSDNEAFAAAADEFCLEITTIRQYWNNHPELQKPEFPAPISAYPR
jgi:hypothetical protein